MRKVIQRILKRGFTLGELLIVVAIIAVLTAIAVPTFNTQLEKSRQTADISNLRGAYAIAKIAEMDGIYNGESIAGKTYYYNPEDGTLEKSEIDQTKIGKSKTSKVIADVSNLPNELKANYNGDLNSKTENLSIKVSFDNASKLNQIKFSGLTGNNQQSNQQGASNIDAAQIEALQSQITALQVALNTKAEKSDANPAGTIISMMSNHAPSGYLICDGTIYNISEYQNLADHIRTEFGTYNYFGGDGVTTFAVPDLKGEFLRGTGTNSHYDNDGFAPGTGSGAAVGVHQHATEEADSAIYNNGFYGIIDSNKNIANAIHTDGYTNDTARYLLSVSASHVEPNYDSTVVEYISRPTNTSVLYCIKY